MILDTCHLRCPLPLAETKLAMAKLNPGEELQVISIDPSLVLDLKVYIRQTGNILLRQENIAGQWRFWLKKQG